MDSNCKNSNETCKVYPDFLFYNEKTHNPYITSKLEYWPNNLTSICDNFKIIKNSNECPDFKCKFHIILLINFS